MDSLEYDLSMQYFKLKRNIRYSKHNDSRRTKRLVPKFPLNYRSSAITSIVKHRSVSTMFHNSRPVSTTFDKSADDDGCYSEKNSSFSVDHSAVESYADDNNEASFISNKVDCENSCIGNYESHKDGCSSLDKTPLHDYTMHSTSDYCEAFAMIARRANLSKTSTNDLLSLIKAGLPTPNNLPATEEQLFLFIGVENLFTKRTICLLCFDELNNRNNICSTCRSTDQSKIAYIYDSNVELIIKRIITRLSSSLNEYKKKIHLNNDYEKTKDIPFGKMYQALLKKENYDNLISLLLHVDGTSLTNSTKLKMWMLSGSIIELPAKLRSKRLNMVIISIWIGYVEPPAKTWLNYCVNRLQNIKSRGIHVLNTKHKLMVFGVTGDCPALSLINNFTGHVGYYSCMQCYVKGEHVITKRQYYYEDICLRGANDYLALSFEAERTNKNLYGHLGRSVLERVLDIPFPASIVYDYLHVSLLGHAKLIIMSIYQQIKPIERRELNYYLSNQRFPHFYNRKLRPLDNFGFVKGTEVRNMLFYGLLPHVYVFMKAEQFAHLALYVCAMRLLHSGDIFNEETSDIAQKLFTQFYRDHETFYEKSQNLKLHLHIHFASLYETHGSLCNLGCFAQESFIGFVSSNYHGTRFQGDSIVHCYNIEFAIQNKKKEKVSSNGLHDIASIRVSDYGCLQQYHSTICTCQNSNSCFKIYRRYTNEDKIFHSLLYNKRRQSISYFVRYFESDKKQYRFGAINLFFSHKGYDYALIEHYRTKELFSSIFKDSSYYFLLKKSADELYFILEKKIRQYDIVLVDKIHNHCIVVEKTDHLFVTNVLSYSEHD